jgi:hypothetical protein
MIKKIGVIVLFILFAASSIFAQPAPIWETGQKASYYSGDDGDLERGVAWPVPRFADHGNGTATDNLTGLMWTKNANLPNGYMNWQQALNYVAGMNAGTYPNYGYHDWRLPNRKELFSLIDHSRYNPALPADHPFTNVQAYYYWSSTTVAGYPAFAWIVGMRSGDVSNGGKYYYDGNGYVWPVRSGQSGSFGDSTISGTVYDGSNGNPLSGALVEVGTYSGTSGSGGSFSISGISSGVYSATVSKTGYASYVSDISIPPSAAVNRNFTLYPTSGEMRVNTINSKYSGFVYFLDGVDFWVTFTANVDWAGHPPDKVRFLTPTGEYDVTTSGNTASMAFNMGTEFGPGGQLQAMAISSDGTFSPLKVADFGISAPVPGFTFNVVDAGDYLFYTADNVALEFFNEGLDEGVIPDDIPIFGSGTFKIHLTPNLDVRLTGNTVALILAGEDLMPGGNIAGFDLDAIPYADISGTFSPTTLDWDWDGEVGMVIALGAKKSWPFIFMAGPVPVPMYAKVGFKLSLDGRVEVLDLTPLTLNGAFNVGPYLRGSLGAGADELLAVEGWLGGGANAGFQWPTEPHFEGLTIYLDGGVTVYAILWEWEDPLLRWDWTYQGSSGSSQKVIESIKHIIPKPVPRDYLNRPHYGRFLRGKKYTLRTALSDGSPYVVATAPLQTQVFPYSEPRLSSNADNLYLCWLFDNPDRTSLNRTMAAFSSYTGTEWSDPIPINDNGTADFHPQLRVFSDGAAIAAWEDEKVVIPEGATFDDMKVNLEILVSFYDAVTKQWQSFQRLTDNGYLDRSPKLAGKTGDNVLLVWLSNETNHLTGDAANPNKLWFTKWNGATWSTPEVIAELPYALLKYDVSYDGGDAYIVMTLDMDSDLSTITDRELYRLSYQSSIWSSLDPLTNDTVADDNPQLTLDPNGNFVLTWLKGNELSSVVNFNMANREVIRSEEYSTNLADFKLASSVDGRLAIVWAEPSEYSSDLWAIFYDPIFQVWGNPKQLTFDTETEKWVTAAFYGTDTLMAVYDRAPVGQTPVSRLTASGKSVSFSIPKPGSTDLYVLKYTMGEDLALDSAGFVSEPPNPAPGQEAILKVTAVNMGDKPESNIPVAFYNGDPANGGIQIAQTTITQTLKPGDSIDVSAPWTVPSTTTPLLIYAVIDPDQTLTDSNRLNNAVNKKFVEPDLTIVSATWEKITDDILSITARVMNQGAIGSQQTTVKFRKDSRVGEVLFTENIGPLAKDQSVDINFVWDASSAPSNVEMYIVVDEENGVEEFNEGNNIYRMSIPIDHLWVLSGTVTGDVQLGVNMILSGPVSKTTSTDSSGIYMFTGLNSGSYTVMPSASGYSFTPPSTNVTVSGANVTGVDFVASVPTLIGLSSFTAAPSDRAVILKWTTASEIDNAGFNIYRAESESGEYVKINASLIPAEGSATQGATYQFIDENVRNRTTYYYKLEDIDLNATSTMHGPVSATVKRLGTRN